MLPLERSSELGAVRKQNRPAPLVPSKTLIRFLDRVTSSNAAPILDAPCGFGRNAFPLAAEGFNVIAVDKGSSSLKFATEIDIRKNSCGR
jgi:2-polyprenyl-3-methyl-5-hydroxy-6-metoxy-1,4-benzoquinol methylase